MLQMKNRTNKSLYLILLVLLIADAAYSFIQFNNQALDGDMAWNLIPAEDVKPILDSPLGIEAILNDQTYANPNRFFCHWSFREYLINMPLFLQRFEDPINSVYLSCAISKLIIHLLLIIILARFITGPGKLFRLDFIIAAFLITALFQTNGYQGYMGIIDPSTTYTFFYALPALVLLLYFLPFFDLHFHNSRPKRLWLIRILWVPLSFVVCLSGPLNPGVVLIVSFFLFTTAWISNYNASAGKNIFTRAINAIKGTPKNHWYFLIPVGLVALYSLYLGKFNSISLENQINLSSIYSHLPEGIYYLLTTKLGYLMLFIVLAINVILIRKYYLDASSKKLLRIFTWIGIFSLLYILLLPLGGYRPYRPNTLRYDTILPITLSLIYIYGATSLFLIRNISLKQKLWYLPLMVLTLIAFTAADISLLNGNDCEKESLAEIAASEEKIIVLDHDCPVLGWEKFNRPEQSRLNAELLRIWGITDKEKRYYHGSGAQFQQSEPK
jgi:hypothetical protein